METKTMRVRLSSFGLSSMIAFATACGSAPPPPVQVVLPDAPAHQSAFEIRHIDDRAQFFDALDENQICEYSLGGTTLRTFVVHPSQGESIPQTHARGLREAHASQVLPDALIFAFGPLARSALIQTSRCATSAMPEGTLQSYVVDPNPIAVSSDIQSIEAEADTRGREQMLLRIRLKPEASARLAHASLQWRGHRIAIFVRGMVHEARAVPDSITNPEFILTLSPEVTEAQANLLANVIREDSIH